MWCVNGMNTVVGLLLFSSIGLLFSAALLVWPEQGSVSAGLLGAGAVSLLWATFTREGGGFLVGMALVLLGGWWMHSRSGMWRRLLAWARRWLSSGTRLRLPVWTRRPVVREQGQALIEFALVLPVLLLLLIGILEFGRLYMEYFNLTYLTNNVSQAAARLGGNVPELDLVLHNNYLPPLRSADVTLQIDTLDPDGGLQCAGSSATCLCEYGDVIRVTTRYPTSVRILGFHQDIGLQASATLFCWRGGAP